MSNKKDFELPITSYEEYLKNLDYITLGIITYYSNFKLEDDFGNENLFRYVYKNKLIDNQNEIEILSKNKFNTVMRNVRKLAKMDNNLVIASNSPNGIVYTINYYTMPHGYYVTIHHEILRFLLNGTNNNTIKVYVYLKYKCSKGEVKITREEIASAIGLSTKCRENLQTISDITTLLNNILIRKRYDFITEINEKGKEVNKKICYYSVLTYEEFKEIYNRINGK